MNAFLKFIQQLFSCYAHWADKVGIEKARFKTNLHICEVSGLILRQLLIDEVCKYFVYHNGLHGCRKIVFLWQQDYNRIHKFSGQFFVVVWYDGMRNFNTYHTVYLQLLRRYVARTKVLPAWNTLCLCLKPFWDRFCAEYLSFLDLFGTFNIFCCFIYLFGPLLSWRKPTKLNSFHLILKRIFLNFLIKCFNCLNENFFLMATLWKFLNVIET